MTAVTKTSVAILAPTVVPAASSGTKAAPGLVGAWVDVTAYNGGLLGGRIENTGGAVGVAGAMQWQWTPDKDATTPKVYDLWLFGGDLTIGAKVTASVPLNKEAKAVRAVCYGNTTSAVTYESDLAASS